MKRCAALSLSLALVSGLAQAQQINRISGRSDESHRVEDATVLADNGFAFAGEQYYFGPGFVVSATLSRTAPDGSPIWTLAMDVPDELDTGFGVRQLSDTSLVFGFHSGDSNQALVLARISDAGAPIWVRSYPGANSYSGGALEIDTTINGHFAVVANRFYLPAGSSGQLLRVDTFGGNVVTNRSYSTDGVAATSAHFNDLDFVPNSNDDYFVTGAVTRVVGVDQYDTDLLVARIQRFSGGIVWCNAYTLPPATEFTRYEEGYGIELASDGTLAVVGRSDDPFEEFGPSGAIHLRINPANGALFEHTYIPDVQVANASLENLANGNLLASGRRSFGDGDSQAQMWEINPVNAGVLWRAEYSDGRTYGADAVEHITPAGNFLLLTGWNSPYSIPSFGFPDEMFIQTDAFGDDGCSSTIWEPERLVPAITVTPVTLVVASVAGGSGLQNENYLSTLDTALVCRAGLCLGDLNDDGFVDDADFVLFAAAYNILDCFDPSMPPGCPADLNDDDFVDDADFVIFVAAYDQLVCE